MQRAFRVLMLIVFAASITGCGESSSVNDTAPSHDTAKEAAAKMPPPPGVKPATPRK